MRTRVAIYGATGAVGSSLLTHLFKGNVLSPGDEIVLVGRDERLNTARLMALRTDLLDAFDDGVVDITICPTLRELETDVFIMAAGATISPQRPSRRDLAAANVALFEETARALAASAPDAFFFIVTNPVELAVAEFSRFLDRHRVLAIGAQQDSIRFSRAIAERLGVHKSAVKASVLGEHGERMVPLWSSAYVTTTDPQDATRLLALRHECESERRRAGAGGERSAKPEELLALGATEAYRALGAVSPDLRIKLEPYVTASLLRSTPNATANVTMECLAALLRADERKVHGQVLLDGEFYGVRGVCGAPLCLFRTGWRLAAFTPLGDDEIAELRAASEAINVAYAHVTADRLPAAGAATR